MLLSRGAILKIQLKPSEYIFLNSDPTSLPENLFRVHHQRKKGLKKTEF